MVFEVTDISHLAERIANDDFIILKLNFNSNPQQYLEIVEDFLKIYPPIEKDSNALYKSIGLQYADENDPLYDAVQQISYIGADNKVQIKRKLGKSYVKKNIIGDQFAAFFDYFDPIAYLQRGRIFISEPGHILQSHNDGACSGTIHYALKTNSKAHIIIEGKEYFIPADGNFYFINTSRTHSVQNLSNDERRIHITFPLNPSCFKVLTQSQFSKMDRYYKQFNIDPKIYTHMKIIP